jgi:hypothetical protein
VGLVSSVLLGFEVGSGEPVEIPIGHMAVTGQSNVSGKTTTLEGVVSRCGLTAIAFLTKRGEGSFRVAQPIAPYFKDRTDWLFISSLLEAIVSEKLKFQRSEIIKLCQDYSGPEGSWKQPKTLADVEKNAETALLKARGIAARVYTELFEYLRTLVPQIETLPYSKKLQLHRGLNVMDLTPYDFALQALVVRSVLEWIKDKATKTIVVIPEAWKFAPKVRRSPVSMAAEELIRQGAALENFIWCDSQDLAGVSAVLLRQVTVWLFGVQRDAREIERTLDHIPADFEKPTRADIATLGRGEFIVAFGTELRRVYVQPAWMTGVHAQAIARGEESVDTAREIVRDFDLEHATEGGENGG